MSLDAFGWILLARVCNQHPWNLQQNIKKEMLLAGMCILFHADLIVVTESCLSLSTFFMYILTAISVTKSCTLSVCVHVCVCVCMCMHSCVCVCVCVIFLWQKLSIYQWHVHPDCYFCDKKLFISVTCVSWLLFLWPDAVHCGKIWVWPY